MSENSFGNFEEENKKNPLLPILKLELKIDESNGQLKKLVEKYNSIIDTWNKNPAIFKQIFETQIKKNLNKIDSDIEKIKAEIKTSTEELDLVVRKMENNN